MALTIELPQVGESVVEGTIGKWLKQPGDEIERYDSLVEVITDKVTMDMPSPVSGKLLRILAQEGETIPMGAPIAEIETGDSPASAASSASASSAATGVAAVATVATEEPPHPAGSIGSLNSSATPVGPTGGGMVEEVAPPVSTPAPTAKNGSARLSPAVRRLAREHSIDISQISGTGMAGRITRDDVLKYLESGVV